MLIADLHIHSKYSRATSKECVPEYLELWARRKGIDLIGTGDFTHPAWRKELEEKLSRQCELNAQLDLENAKAVDADLSGPEEERETDDRMESAAIVAEDKGAYPADREGRTR